VDIENSIPWALISSMHTDNDIMVQWADKPSLSRQAPRAFNLQDWELQYIRQAEIGRKNIDTPNRLYLPGRHTLDARLHT
jgi:hypothetical protein